MTARLLMIDNYDSFTYNLYQYLSELGADVEVVRNDAISPNEVDARGADGLVLSPGPGRPEDAGVCVPLIRQLAGRLPILGVCLGHQAITVAFGGAVVPAPELRHGKTSEVAHRGDGLYRGVASPFPAVRYHSLVADRSSLPACLEIDAETVGSGTSLGPTNGSTVDPTIMGLRHRKLPIFGVQFHPESILTDCGKTLLQNFLDVVASGRQASVAAPELTRGE